MEILGILSIQNYSLVLVLQLELLPWKGLSVLIARLEGEEGAGAGGEVAGWISS